MSMNVESVSKYKRPKKKFFSPNTLTTAKYTILGREINDGLLFKTFLYTIFVATSYVYIEPIIRMIVTMIMSEKDLINPTVTWIPNSIYFGHIQSAMEYLNYWPAFSRSMLVSVVASIFHVITCGFAGYALARLEFPFKKTVFALVLVSFIIPPQVIVLPTIIAFNSLGLNGSIFTLIIPSILGFGVKGALYVIIFRQFFTTQPKELEEAARIDGASALKFYLKVMLPLAKPAIIVVFLFSFVWTWNDTYFPQMYLTGSSEVPLAMEMLQMDRTLTSFIESQQISSHEASAIKMASGFLSILPPLLVFLFFQRHFVEGVERTGLVE